MKGLIRRAEVVGKITSADKQMAYRQMTGTAHGFCKTQTQMRVSAEFPSGRTEPRYVMQSRPACKGYEPLEEDDA